MIAFYATGETRLGTRHTGGGSDGVQRERLALRWCVQQTLRPLRSHLWSVSYLGYYDSRIAKYDRNDLPWLGLIGTKVRLILSTY